MPTLRSRDVYATVGIAITVVFLWQTVFVDFVIFAGILLAIFLRRLSGFGTRYTRLPRIVSLLLAVAFIALVIVSLVYFFSGTVIDQFNQLSTRLFEALSDIERHMPSLGLAGAVGGIPDVNLLSSGVVGRLFGFASHTATLAGGVLASIFFGIYFAAEPRTYEAALVALFPPQSRGRVRQILNATADTLWYWSLGRLFSMSVVGVLTTLGLWALGMPLVLGGLAGILTFVPYLGSIAASAPAIVLALSVTPTYTAYVVLLYLGVHFTEGYILVPLVQRRAAHLPPAAILSSQLLLAALAGIVGVTFATPLVAALVPIVRMAYVEDVLEAPRGA